MPVDSVAGFDVRSWATRSVQWAPARTALKRGVHAYAAARGRRLARASRLPDPVNVYTASSPKAGSQWMKAVFDHPVVRARTGLFTLPQLDYQAEPTRLLPAATFVPGIYASYDEFRRRPQHGEHRVVYMFRDPRDIVVSGYYAAVSSHRRTHLREVEELRDRIRALPFAEGLLLLIHSAEERLREIESWACVDDPVVASFHLETVAADPRSEVVRMLAHCGVRLDDDSLETLLADVSRDALQAKDLATRPPGSESHYRVAPKSFREALGPEHLAAIEEIVPGLVSTLGYAT